jgi:preprotein translocase subunit SecB
MAEPAAPEQTPPQMRIVRQFLRDLSFENIGVNGGFDTAKQPQINVNVALDAKQAGEGVHMVALKLTATAKVEEATVFLTEVDYAGIFELKNVPQAQLHPFLMIECPRFLFPFVRRIVSDVTRDGGYPPLMIDNVDFMSLYRAEIERRQAEAAKGGAGPNGGGALN